MPYIPQERRTALNPVADDVPDNPGELNYQLTRLISKYLGKHGVSYQRINDAVGALECAKLEAYSRIAVPYEETKITDNGDVYHEVNA